MTDARTPSRRVGSLERLRVPSNGPAQRHRLALEIASRYPDDPGTARELLEMLGLVDDKGRRTW